MLLGDLVELQEGSGPLTLFPCKQLVNLMIAAPSRASPGPLTPRWLPDLPWHPAAREETLAAPLPGGT